MGLIAGVDWVRRKTLAMRTGGRALVNAGREGSLSSINETRAGFGFSGETGVGGPACEGDGGGIRTEDDADKTRPGELNRRGRVAPVGVGARCGRNADEEVMGANWAGGGEIASASCGGTDVDRVLRSRGADGDVIPLMWRGSVEHD